MLIYAKNIESILSKLTKGVVVFLYGPDEDMVQYCLVRIVNYVIDKLGDHEKVFLEYSEIKTDPSLFMQNCNSVTLFNVNKVLVVDHCGSSITKELTAALPHANKNNLTVFVSGDCPKHSSMRSVFELSQDYIAIACYKPDFEQTVGFIRKTCSKYGLNANNQVLNTLAHIMPSSYMAIEQEIEKLSIYKNEDRNIANQDVIALYDNVSDMSIDDLCSAIISQDANLVVRAINRIEYHDINFMLIIRSLLNFLLKVAYIKQFIDDGMSMASAIAKLQPPVFFRQKDNIIIAAKSLTFEQVYNTIKVMNDLEIIVKTTKLDKMLLVKQALFALCVAV